MLLADLLEELRENILHDRSDRVSGTSDYLWSDKTLVRYIDQAERRFARKGLVIRDATTADVVEVTLVEGQSRYVLHPAVIAVISARYDTRAQDLIRSGHSIFNAYRRPDTDWFDSSTLTDQTGEPIAFSTDEEVSADDNETMTRVTLRVYPVPNEAADTKKIYLRVCRFPLERLDPRRLKVHPEVPEEHQIEMLDWAAYLALRIQDQDAGNAKAAAEFRSSFEAHALEARQHAMRKLFAPSGWGFGRGGYTWER